MTDPNRIVQRDFAIMFGLTGLFAVLSIRFDLSETLLAIAHAEEWAQLDEVPQILLVFTVCLAWFAWRRLTEARKEINLRRTAEARLAEALFEIRRLGARATDAQEQERRSLAREIHDELGQYLVALRLDAAAAREDSTEPKEALDQLTRSIQHHVEHMHASVRGIIARLRPTGLDELGLAAALESHLQYWRGRLGSIDIVLDASGIPTFLPEEASLVLYRLTQECLVNLSRHSGASGFLLRLAKESDIDGRESINFLAKDNGRGCESGSTRAGYGLAGMRERVESLGGEFSVDSSPGKGFRVHARLPLIIETKQDPQAQ